MQNTTEPWNISSSSTSAISCKTVLRHEYLIFSFISVVQILLNTSIIVAVGRGRRILRHNYVYAYVTSTLGANVVLGIFGFMTMMSDYIASAANVGRVDWTKAEDRAFMIYWSLRNSITASLFLVMSGNIAGLIYGLRESSYFIGKFMRRSLTRAPISKNPSLKSRKMKAIVIILIVWLIPCLLALVPAASESVCLQNCICKPASYNDYICRTNEETTCSFTWVPLPKYFLGIVTVSWVLLLAGVIFLLLNAIARFNKTIIPRTNEFSDSPGTECCLPFASCRWKYNHSIKLLMAITISYIVLTLPAMLVLLLDILSKAFHLPAPILKTSFMLAIVYAFISPMLMVKYMPGLRSAILKTFLNVMRSEVKVTQTSNASTENDNSIGKYPTENLPKTIHNIELS